MAEMVQQTQFHDLPPDILGRIFGIVPFRDRIRAERVCRTWQSLLLRFGWSQQRWLLFTRAVLHVVPKKRKMKQNAKKRKKRKEKRKKNAKKKKRRRRKVFDKMALQLVVPLRLLTVIRRCESHLMGLHLSYGIGVDTRFGRLFAGLMPALVHLRVDARLDVWHLHQIRDHLAERLISLSVETRENEEGMKEKEQFKYREALASLFAKCGRLECLRTDVFDNFFRKSSPDSKKEEKEEAVPLPSVPPTVRFLMSRSRLKARGLTQVLERCPQLQYFLPNMGQSLCYEEDLQAISGDVIEKLMGLQWPYVFSIDYSHLQLHPRLASLRAVKLEPWDGVQNPDLLLLAEHCPQLEHLDFKRKYCLPDRNSRVPLHDLEPALLKFTRLASLGLTLEVRHRLVGCCYMRIPVQERMSAEGEPLVEKLLEMLTNLNAINPLRSLEINGDYDLIIDRANFDCQNVLHVLQNFTHLESLSCPLEEAFGHVGKFREFAGQVKTALDEAAADLARPCTSKSLRFLYYMPSCAINGFTPYNAGSLINWSREAAELEITSLEMPSKSDWRQYHFWHWPVHSVVLDQILEQAFGTNTKRILFS